MGRKRVVDALVKNLCMISCNVLVYFCSQNVLATTKPKIYLKRTYHENLIFIAVKYIL